MMNIRNLMILVLVSASCAQGAEQVRKDSKDKKEDQKKQEELKREAGADEDELAEAAEKQKPSREHLRRLHTLRNLNRFAKNKGLAGLVEMSAEHRGRSASVSAIKQTEKTQE